MSDLQFSRSGPDASAGDGGGSVQVSVAEDLATVTRAWTLVYEGYRRINIVEPNSFGIHTVPHALGYHACVAVGRVGSEIVTTMTTIHDSPMGLPLDSIYGAELQSLRNRNRRLCEVGLFADRRESISRNMMAIFELMRYTYWFAGYWQIDDFVIGVHPHHAAFYERAFAFEQIGAETVYPTVHNAPVVLLRMDLPAMAMLDPLPRGIAYARKKPPARAAFTNRYRFDPRELEGSTIQGYLRSIGKQAGGGANRPKAA